MNIDLLAPDLLADPYRYYQQWRAEGPVLRNDTVGWWMVPRWAEVNKVYRAPGLYSSNATIYFGAAGEAMAVNTMGSADPPEHTRLRGVASRAFTPRAVAQLEPMMQALVDKSLDGLGPGDTIDITNDLAYPLASNVIAGLLGVPAADRGRFRKYADDLSRARDINVAPEAMDQARAGIRGLHKFLGELIAFRRASPSDKDLIGRMVLANEGNTLSNEELVATCTMLLVAGYEATVALVGNSVLCLIEHPDERRRLVDEPSLIHSAVEECLRYAGPVHAGLRMTRDDVVLSGVEIPKGELLMVLPASANRDERHFPDADRFDIARNPRDHFAFGTGIHVCLGAPLARMELRVALASLLRRSAEFERADDTALAYHKSFIGRSLERLDIRL